MSFGKRKNVNFFGQLVELQGLNAALIPYLTVFLM